MFWDNLSPNGAGKVALNPGCEIAKLLTEQYGSVDDFVTLFKNEAANMGDSEWAWLVYNKESR